MMVKHTDQIDYHKEQEIVRSSSSSYHDEDVKQAAVHMKNRESVAVFGEGKISREEIKEENIIQKEEKTAQPTNGDVKKEDDAVNMMRKLLVLDLNGLLVDSVQNSFFIKRPFCEDFLKFCFERFNVGVWSSKIKKNVDRVVDFVMGDLKQNLLFCWDQSHCTKTGFVTIENTQKPLVLKELKKLWDNGQEHSLPWEKGVYNESNTLLLDDSPYKALCNPLHTAIFPFTYTREDTDDNSLGQGGDLRVYLEGLAVAENVQKYVEQHPFGQYPITNKHPSWDFYQCVVCSIAAKTNQQMDRSIAAKRNQKYVEQYYPKKRTM